jgi:hypothetical protein
MSDEASKTLPVENPVDNHNKNENFMLNIHYLIQNFYLFFNFVFNYLKNNNFLILPNQKISLFLPARFLIFPFTFQWLIFLTPLSIIA